MSQATEQSGSLSARWKALPRALRWAAFAGMGIGVYFGVIEPALGEMAKWNARADSKEISLTKFDNERRSRQDMDNAATLGVSRFGIVQAPGDAGERSQAFNRKVATILEQNGAKRPTTTTREVALPTNSVLVRNMGSDYRVERLVNDVQFDGEPEQVAKIVADLESSQEVASVSRVEIRQNATEAEGARLVHAMISVEAWQYKKKVRTK